ncbi:MAG: hypothetical protein LBV26_04920 [Bacteroidales bacterium]|jgi:hypothetical protein|nr:hypothetical protein [Bacteroidales bacterium]
MKYFKFIGWLVFASILTACDQESDKNEPQKSEPGLLSWEEFNSFLSQETDATIAVTSSNTVASQEIKGTSACEVYFRNPSLSLKSTSGQGVSVTVGDIVLQESEPVRRHSTHESMGNRPPAADHLFGTDVPFKIEAVNSMLKGTSALMTDTMYIPLLIKLEAPKLQYLVGTESGDCIAPGQTVAWNTDEKNVKGVIVMVSFHPRHEIRDLPKWVIKWYRMLLQCPIMVLTRSGASCLPVFPKGQAYRLVCAGAILNLLRMMTALKHSLFIPIRW